MHESRAQTFRRTRERATHSKSFASPSGPRRIACIFRARPALQRRYVIRGRGGSSEAAVALGHAVGEQVGRPVLLASRLGLDDAQQRVGLRVAPVADRRVPAEIETVIYVRDESINETGAFESRATELMGPGARGRGRFGADSAGIVPRTCCRGSRGLCALGRLFNPPHPAGEWLPRARITYRALHARRSVRERVGRGSGGRPSGDGNRTFREALCAFRSGSEKWALCFCWRTRPSAGIQSVDSEMCESIQSLERFPRASRRETIASPRRDFHVF